MVWVDVCYLLGNVHHASTLYILQVDTRDLRQLVYKYETCETYSAFGGLKSHSST